MEARIIHLLRPLNGWQYSPNAVKARIYSLWYSTIEYVYDNEYQFSEGWFYMATFINDMKFFPNYNEAFADNFESWVIRTHSNHFNPQDCYFTKEQPSVVELDGDTIINTWSSVDEASQDTGIAKSTLLSLCASTNGTHTAKKGKATGRTFKYN